MTRFVWLDEVYAHAWGMLPNHSYEAWFDQCFGTADFWDIALRVYGHESDTLIENCEPDILGTVANIQPDVLCVQNVGKWYPSLIRARGIKSKLVAFCSYRAANENLVGWDVVFTSFPWLADAMKQAGKQRGEYMPLAFGGPVLDRVVQPAQRDLPLTFVGGLGYPIWKRGTDDFAAIARNNPEFQWWGYQVGRLPDELMTTYQGPAYGKKYFEILMRSQITLNRHGEIAKGFGNNMRQYDALGCGAYLFTDHMGEVEPTHAPIWTYPDGASNVESVRQMLDTEWEQTYRDRGRAYILENHTYEHRAPQFLKVIESL